MAAIEPLTGKRLAHLDSLRHPYAHTIRLVQDNLNTHDKSAIYETFSPEEAFALAQRFEFFFTPKSASWRGMIEIEFSALARQCLHRRIPTIEQMEREVLSKVLQREQKAIPIHWQFSLQKARQTFQKARQTFQKARQTFQNRYLDIRKNDSPLR